MPPKLKETLSINPINIILYKDTGQPYIDDDRYSYLFTRRAAAFDYCKDDSRLTVSEERYYKYDELCSILFASGAIQIKCSVAKEFFAEPIIRFHKKKYYNPDLNFIVNGLVHTQQKKYLYALSGCKYIVPIKVTDGTVINYGIARIKDREFFLAFTDLDEFAIWCTKVEGYSAIELTFYELTSLSSGKDIIINIMGNRLVLARENIAKILMNYPPPVIKPEKKLPDPTDTDQEQNEGE
jgi:hypothetical protein